MGLYWEPSIRSLNPIAMSHASALIGQSTLAFEVFQMFDHRVTEDNVERLVLEGQSTRIGDHPARARLGFRVPLESDIYDDEPGTERNKAPVKGRATQIEDQGIGAHFEPLQEPLHPLLSKAPL